MDMMQRPVKIWFGMMMLCMAFISCQRVIDVNIANTSGKLVIEGNLTDESGPQLVTISRSVAYNSTNVFPPVSGAKVTITDPLGIVYNLLETATAGTYGINGFKGKSLNVYELNVRVDGTLYTAASLMPMAVNLDSLTLSNEVVGNTAVKTVSASYTDPPGTPNQYKFVMYVNGVLVKQIFTENDNLSDGRAVSTMLYQREITLNPGDWVDVEMQCIDTNMFNYWNNLSSQGGNDPANSATPANPPSNFNNNALGYFSAHTVQRKSMIVP
jgi:hypothetical protein